MFFERSAIRNANVFFFNMWEVSKESSTKNFFSKRKILRLPQNIYKDCLPVLKFSLYSKTNKIILNCWVVEISEYRIQQEVRFCYRNLPVKCVCVCVCVCACACVFMYEQRKTQLDATQWFLLYFRFAQHISGTIMPFIRSSRLYSNIPLPRCITYGHALDQQPPIA
jgi:hypothetical protein